MKTNNPPHSIHFIPIDYPKLPWYSSTRCFRISRVELPLKGNCLCGAIAYEIAAAPLDAGYCHCATCRKSSGAPAVAWGTVATKAFQFTKGKPVAYASSLSANRFFCGACGTQLVFQYANDPQTTDFTLGSLNDPEAVKPEYHIWTMSRVEWFETSDELPRHIDRGPDKWT